MKKQHLFTLDINLIKQLHAQVGRGFRSQFVEKAIRARLNNDETFSTGDIDIRQLMASLLFRLEERTDAASEMMKVFLKEELA